MLIPIRCFTCGSVTGDKWTPFVEAVLEQKNKSTEASSSDLDIEYININSIF